MVPAIIAELKKQGADDIIVFVGGVIPRQDYDMPAFAGTMSDDEIRAVLEFIKSTWPERQQAIQKARSQAEAEK